MKSKNNKKQTRAYYITDEGVKMMITKEVNNKRIVIKDNNKDDK